MHAAARRAISSTAAMTQGFAFVAWPAQYRNAGLMAFIVHLNDVVYQKDLGAQTADQAKAIESGAFLLGARDIIAGINKRPHSTKGRLAFSLAVFRAPLSPTAGERMGQPELLIVQKKTPLKQNQLEWGTVFTGH